MARLQQGKRIGKGDSMTLSANDMVAIMIALVSLNTVLVVAFRRLYVLEQRAKRYGYDR